MRFDTSSPRARSRIPAHVTAASASRSDRGVVSRAVTMIQQRVRTLTATGAATGARSGVGVAAAVAAWVGLRLALGGPLPPEAGPLAEAFMWSRERAGAAGGGMSSATAAPAMTLLASHLAAAALVGALASTAIRSATVGLRLTLLLTVLAAESALWQLAGWHAGPWLRAAVWYHAVTAVLTSVVVLERTVVAMPQLGDALQRARGGAGADAG